MKNLCYYTGALAGVLAGVPASYAALTTGQTAPLEYLVLIMVMLTCYWFDTIINTRPVEFAFTNSIGLALNTPPLLVAINPVIKAELGMIFVAFIFLILSTIYGFNVNTRKN